MEHLSLLVTGDQVDEDPRQPLAEGLAQGNDPVAAQLLLVTHHQEHVGVDGLGKVLLTGAGNDDVVLLGNGLYPLDLLVSEIVQNGGHQNLHGVKPRVGFEGPRLQ